LIARRGASTFSSMLNKHGSWSFVIATGAAL